MKNCFVDDKLIPRKRHRPLQPNEIEQSNTSEKKKEIFVINYGSNELNENTNKKRIKGQGSKLFGLEKNENIIKKPKGKENTHKRIKPEVNFNLKIIKIAKKEKNLISENDTVQPIKSKNEFLLDYDKFLEEVNSNQAVSDSNNVNKNLLSVNFLKKGILRSEKAPSFKKAKSPVRKVKSNFKIINKTFTKLLDKNKIKKRKIGSNQKFKNKNCSDIYNINNFIVQTNNSNKIVPKTNNMIEIKIPKFCDVQEIIEEKESYSSDSEDTSDEIYLKYHDQYELREKEYKSRIFCSADKNNKKKEKKYKNKVETAGTDTSDTNFKIRINLEVSCPNFDFKEEEIPVDNILE